MFSVLIMAAGSGSRACLGFNKVFLEIENKPLFLVCAEKFIRAGIKDVIIVTNPDDYQNVLKITDLKVIKGGKERADSVRNGLEAVNSEYVLIHDAARPFINEQLIIETIKSLKKHDVAFVGKKVTDTIKLQEDNKLLTLNRNNLIQAETPQGFKTTLIKDCHEKALNDKFLGTDDISLIEKYYPNQDIKVVLHQTKNIKITHQSDLEALKSKENNMFRIGHSWDIHRLVEGRKLILGGVEIPFDKGLLGHSDADCLYHVVGGSLLGALSLGDIGSHFPDDAKENKDLDSKVIVQSAYKLVKEKGYEINNIDLMISAEKPKMREYIDLMRKNIADCLETDIENVSVKATTTEKLGSIGEGKAIACEAVVLLKKIHKLNNLDKKTFK